jgi:hypothetical protein
MIVMPPGQEQAARATAPASPVATATTPSAAPAVDHPPAPAAAAPGPAAVPPVAAATAPAKPGVAEGRPKGDFMTTGLDLISDPPVEVALDKKPFGRTPIVIPAPPGRHVLTLSDQAKGINQSRVVTVKKEGVTPLRLTVGRGTLGARRWPPGSSWTAGWWARARSTTCTSSRDAPPQGDPRRRRLAAVVRAPERAEPALRRGAEADQRRLTLSRPGDG